MKADYDIVREAIHEDNCGSRWKRQCDCRGFMASDALDRIEAHTHPGFKALNKRIAELETALKRIRDGRDYAPWSMDESWKHRLSRTEMREIARSALEEEGRDE